MATLVDHSARLTGGPVAKEVHVSSTCNVEDFTGTTVSVPDPLSSVLKVRADRALPGVECLGAPQGTMDPPRRSNQAPLARPVRSAHPFPLSPAGDNLLGVTL
jgi:hypothetical protein